MKSLFAAVALLVVCSGLAQAQAPDVQKEYEHQLERNPPGNPLAVPPPTKCATVPMVPFPSKAPKRAVRPDVEYGPDTCRWPRA